MLHRLKLRLLYGDPLDRDKEAKKMKLRYILLSGFAVYPPFVAIAYLIYFETRVVAILMIGLLSALTCIPVAFYGYAKGFGAPFKTLFRERREELLWLGVKIGFIYPFFLYFMILGLVEFLLDYGAVRAAMISFVATAVARDGFEIGYYRAHSPDQKIHIFPDGQSICTFLKSDTSSHLQATGIFICLSGLIGFVAGAYLKGPIAQTVFTGIVVGALSTVAYLLSRRPTPLKFLAQFFLWPGFTMAVTYFIGLLYLYRTMLKIQISPPVDLAIIMALSAGWLTLETRFVGHLKTTDIGCKSVEDT
jgi:hypothetical protein